MIYRCGEHTPLAFGEGGNGCGIREGGGRRREELPKRQFPTQGYHTGEEPTLIPNERFKLEIFYSSNRIQYIGISLYDNHDKFQGHMS